MWAEFEGMKTKPGYPIIKGPFLIEVYELRRSRGLPRFGARLLQTQQRFTEISEATEESAQDKVAAIFEKQLKPWTK